MGFLDTVGDIAGSVAGGVTGAADQAAGAVQAPFIWAANDAGNFLSNHAPSSGGLRDFATGALDAAVGGPLRVAGYGRDAIGSDAGAVQTNPNDQRTIDQKLADLAQAQGLDPSTYKTAWDLQKQVADITGTKFDEKTVANQLATQIVTDAQTNKKTLAQQTAQAQLQHQQEYVQKQQQASDQQFALALQAQATQFMQPYIQQIVQGGDAEASALSSLAGQVPAGMRGVFQQQATLASTGAMKLAGAYAAQAAYAPGFLQQFEASRAAQQQAQADYDYKQAQTAQAQALGLYYEAGAQNGGPGGSGGSSDFNSTVSSLTGP